MSDYVAMVPWEIGYYPPENHIQVVVQNSAGRIATVGAEWTVGIEPEVAGPPIGANVADVTQARPGDSVLVIGYGPEAHEYLPAVAGPLAQEAGTAKTRLIQVDEEFHRIAALDGTWDEWRDLPTAPLEVSTSGRALPAPDKDAHLARFAPLDQPLFEQPDGPEVAELARLRPSARADLARAAVDRLSENRTGSDPESMRTLGHLMNSSRTIRDAALVHAVGSTDRINALTQTFRAAPPQMRDEIGAAAAAAMAFSAESTTYVRPVLAHVDPDNSLAQLVKESANNGLPMHEAFAVMPKVVADQLEKQDQEYATQQSATQLVNRLTGHSPAPGVRDAQAGPERPGSPAAGADGPQIER
ncbi:MAG: hypothetical protein ACTHYM_14025 [Actinomycetaceae bacterium]